MSAAQVNRRECKESLFSGLGIFGLTRIEPILLAALISDEPLLLIGPHGTGKSYLLARLSEALGYEWRHYNASLLNYDDLVGYPLPNARGELEFVKTPASLWDAQILFFDELSRCRPELQNKLFPIIHERRVQGIPLARLIYRWSAMNPPSGQDDEDPNFAYHGAEPLDAALADRFAWIVPMPDWREYSIEDQERIIRSSDEAPNHPAKQALRQAIARGKQLLAAVRIQNGDSLGKYVRIVVQLCNEAGLPLSPRRAALLWRNVLAVHAAQRVRYPDAALADSAYLALEFSLPQPAIGHNVPLGKLAAIHRQAWELAKIPVDDPRSWLLLEPDPLVRATQAAELQTLTAEELSGIVADALAALRPGHRHVLAYGLFQQGGVGRLVAAVAEQCAELYGLVAERTEWRESVSSRGTRHQVWQAIVEQVGRLAPNQSDTPLVENLLTNLFVRGELTDVAQVHRVLADWKQAWATLAGDEA